MWSRLVLRDDRRDLFTVPVFRLLASVARARMTADEEFAAFWLAYPRHRAKLQARKAFTRARAAASLDDILAGVARYLAGKPMWQQYAYPASWLNGGCWEDEYEPEPRPGAAPQYSSDFAACQHVPTCENRTWHDILLRRERGEL